MPDKMTSVFFYGLFMDVKALEERGYDLTDPRLAEVKGFRLQIGNRASMAPSAGDSVWGLVVTMAQNDLDSLYSDQSVADYRPEPVVARLVDGSQISSYSYILSDGNDNPPNRDYASRLAQLVARLDFPSDYIKVVEDFATTKCHSDPAQK
jgi:hypothetical protein